MFFALQKTKMRTFCFAEHFPKENVQQNKMLQMHLMQKCIFATHQQNVRAAQKTPNTAFLHKKQSKTKNTAAQKTNT